MGYDTMKKNTTTDYGQTSEDCTANVPSISILINAVHYFLDWALIVVEENRFLLKVKRGGNVTTSTEYSTLKGAKGAFFLSYKNAGYKKNVRPEWSKNYVPDSNWLRQKMDQN